MPSRVELNPQLPQSSIDTSVMEAKVRAGGRAADVAAADAIKALTAQVQRLQSALRASTSLKHISLASADIQDLIVGGEDGPGQLTILSGPPEYAPVGWDGTEENGDSATITTFNGTTVTTSDEHVAVPGYVVHIQGNSAPYRNGHFVVLTTPTNKTYTVADPGGANGTGGTSTVVFAGGWRRQFAIGETEADGGAITAPLFTNPQGQVFIGKNGSISLLDPVGLKQGFLGVEKEAVKPVASVATDGTGHVRLGITGHGYSEKDDLWVNLPGLPSMPNDTIVASVVDVNTIDTTMPYSGGYTGGGTAYRYRGVIWVRALAGGGSGYSDAPLRTFRDGSIRVGGESAPHVAINTDGSLLVGLESEPHFFVAPDGSLMIGLPTGARVEVDATTGDLSVVDGSVSIDASPIMISISAIDGVKVTKTGSFFSQMRDLGLVIGSDGATYPRVLATQSAVSAEGGTSNAHAAKLFTSVGGQLQLFSALGNLLISGDGSTGAFACESLTVAGSPYTPFVSSNYYTKSEIDSTVAALISAINGKSSSTHNHNVTTAPGSTSGPIG
jgi:hypothetical protein